MKKILTVSLFAMMAVSAANAEIASTNYVENRTGDISGLTTTAKDNLTVAVNELNTKLGTVTTTAGNAATKTYVDETFATKDALSSVSAVADAAQTETEVKALIQSDAVNTVATGGANGTIKFDGNDVAVKGLGSAAYTESTAYDAAGTAQALIDGLSDGAISTLTTTVQGLETSVETLSSTKANAADVYTKTQIDNTVNTLATKTELNAVSAVADAAQTETEVKALIQSDAVNTVATGTTNGTIKVDNTEVKVAGLGSAAYTDSSAYAVKATETTAANNATAIETIKTNLNVLNVAIPDLPDNTNMYSLVADKGTIKWEKVNPGN